MNKLHYKFIVKLIILTIAVSAIGELVFAIMPWEKPTVFYYIIAFYFVISAFTHWWLTGALKKNSRRFPAYFMGATSIKLFSSLIFIVLYSIKNPAEAKTFLLTFFLIYLIFSAFETTEILTFSSKYRKDSEPGNQG
ncbi:MAG: hypothetical protein H0X62_12600 [Bacteroidetes bacterium]|nr:hypothetical protein [Bacteroidota bacterium]